MTGSAGHAIVGGTAGSAGRESEGADPHAQTGAHIPGTAGTGGGILPPVPSGGYEGVSSLARRARPGLMASGWWWKLYWYWYR